MFERMMSEQSADNFYQYCWQQASGSYSLPSAFRIFLPPSRRSSPPPLGVLAHSVGGLTW